MMTPRGVSDVHVYTPARVEARYGIRPDQIPDFIGLKGDTSDNIPGIPGIGDKTAGQLIAQYGALEAVIEHADELSPARRKNVVEFADQARTAKELATMRRDLELDCDPSELVLAPPDRSELREMFRRFEFRNLFNRIDELDEAVPAAQRIVAGTPAPWVEAAQLPRLSGPVSVAVQGERVAVAQDGEPVVVAPLPLDLALALRDTQITCHDFKALPRLTMLPAEDTMIAAYLIEPGRPAYELDDLASEYGVEAIPEPAAEEQTAALVRAAELPRRLAAPIRARLRERGSEELYDRIELPLTAVLAAMEDAGIRIDTYRMGEITARLSDRVEELEARAYELADEEFMLGSTQQLARVLFEKLELTPARKGKTDYSQVELRILAHVSGEPKLREAFARGEDIHAATAAEVLGKEQATLSKDERNIAKMVNFGIIYGISAFGLSENLEISREEAQTYIDAYLARFPMVQDFIEGTIEQAARDVYVTTLLGRRRPVPEIRASNRQTRSPGEPLAVNSGTQGTAAELLQA